MWGVAKFGRYFHHWTPTDDGKLRSACGRVHESDRVRTTGPAEMCRKCLKSDQRPTLGEGEGENL
jgi:hypothetical protein